MLYICSSNCSFMCVTLISPNFDSKSPSLLIMQNWKCRCLASGWLHVIETHAMLSDAYLRSEIWNHKDTPRHCQG
jgi:hypothetical protein